MSMRSDFESILKNYGHDVYLQRHTLGPGGEIEYSNSLEKHTSRFSIGVFRSLPSSREEAIEGIFNTSERAYYFKYDVHPFENDRVYDYNDRAPSTQEIWLIDAAVGMRGEDGRIIYYVAGVTREEPN